MPLHDSIAGAERLPDIRHMPRGWECPHCGRINAPCVMRCDCQNGPDQVAKPYPDGTADYQVKGTRITS